MKIILHDHKQNQWLLFKSPLTVITARLLPDVQQALQRIDAAVAEGLYAAGFIQYEAAPAFDSALKAHPPTSPLLNFGIYKTVESWHPPVSCPTFSIGSWYPTVTSKDYHAAVKAIKSHISKGDTYQINYTFRLRSSFKGEPLDLFLNMLQAQGPHLAAFIQTETATYCSASPELFFYQEGDEITCRPMKGTIKRGCHYQEDKALRQHLLSSPKERAENVMILDMLRNDLGRICTPGKVKVKELFTIEKYPTLFQMTSTVTAHSQLSWPHIMTALFPCASITGAPKYKSTHLIAELESTPRGIYTGTIGYISPARRAQFNVAIRTVTIQENVAEYGTGSGIVWDSDPEQEYRECLLKAEILPRLERPQNFELLESMLWEPEQGIFLKELHLKRLKESAIYFDYPFDADRVEYVLNQATQHLNTPSKLRLTLSSLGNLSVEAHPLSEQNSGPINFIILPEPLHTHSPFIFNKTTYRIPYDQALHQARSYAPQIDDVLVRNLKGELTEFTTANLVIDLGGQLFTPPTKCGLLAGTYREYLLRQGKITEKVLYPTDLTAARSIWAVNSVRKIRKARLIARQPPLPATSS